MGIILQMPIAEDAQMNTRRVMLHVVSKPHATVNTPREPCICIFSALYEPHVGGVEVYTKGVAQALVDAGCKVIVVTSNTNNAPTFEIAGNVDVVRLPCNSLLGGRFPFPKNDRESKRLWSQIEKQPIDHIVVNTRFYPLSILGLRFAKRKGIQPILIEHGSAHLTLGNKVLDFPLHIVEHAMTALAKRYSPNYYAVSKKASEWLSHFSITSYGEIPNSINANEYVEGASTRNFRLEFNIPDDAIIIVSAGRFVPEKGVLQLAKATKIASEKGCNLFTIMAGDGPLLYDVKKLHCPAVITPGMLNKNDLAALLLQADFFCLPSRSEGFSTVLLEAAACNTAAIATDIGGMQEISPTREYGIILPSMKTEDIANALEKAAGNRNQSSSMGSNAARRVREYYTWDKSAQLLLAACKKAAEQEKLT